MSDVEQGDDFCTPDVALDYGSPPPPFADGAAQIISDTSTHDGADFSGHGYDAADVMRSCVTNGTSGWGCARPFMRVQQEQDDSLSDDGSSESGGVIETSSSSEVRSGAVVVWLVDPYDVGTVWQATVIF